jgi:acetyltransferase-like isoleucine patch superfamily enzyme
MKTFLKNILYQNTFLQRLLLWLRDNQISDAGNGNRIMANGARLESCRIHFRGSNNQLEFLPGASVKDCLIEVIGDHHRLLIGENVVLTQSILWFEDHNCLISIGKGTTMQRNGHIAVTEPGRKIEIGDNCMFSFDVDIRNGDSHSIIDASTGKRINWAKNIHIGEHVWLGAYTQILGGAEIEKNAIIGIRSLVKGKIEEGVIAAGIPAKAIRSGFTWDSRRILEGDPGPE